ncbi:hypothetical protein [Amycolatopsis sp. w19]|uniref:hypothetical protein n=1 Tax=Amycolatopsis sp. w19 TaxID=3448134 RepID=UPI003F1E3A5B
MSAGVDVVVAALAVSSPVVVPADVAAVGTVPATLVAPLPAGSPVIAEVAAVTGLDESDRAVSAELTGARTRATGETGRVADAVPGDVAEPVLVVVVVVGVDADAEVVFVAACRGCTSPDTSDVTVVSGLVPAVVSVAWSLVREGPVSSSAWATPTPRSIKPPASNPA